MDDQAYSVAADQLRSYVERVEQLNSEKQDISDQIKEVMAEAKGNGFDAAAIKQIIALRKKDPDDRAEAEAILTMYREALGV